MHTRKNICILLTAVLMSLNFIKITYSQEYQPSDYDAGQVMTDSIDYVENLLDSNEIYKKQFDSLSKDGEWVETKKSDLIRDLNNITGKEELDIYPETDNVIYVWRPYGMNSYWNPYSNGNWVFTYNGWIWMSNYNWGWGPYNYGRWYCSSTYGWIWFPGNVWAPNWVTWRHNNQYVGWYPSCPRIHWRGYRNVYTNHMFAYSPKNWVFVNKKDFRKNIDKTTIVSSDINYNILKNSQKLKAASYSDPNMPKFKYHGPDVKVLSAETGENISPEKVSAVKSGNYEPIIKNNNSSPVRNVKPYSVTNGSKSIADENTVTNSNADKKNNRSKSNGEKNPPVNKSTEKQKANKNRSHKVYDPPPENVKEENQNTDKDSKNSEQPRKDEHKNSNDSNRNSKKNSRK
ncbi:MAG TPA: hypothetical protein PKC91_01940 [Ignavibacteria bacterium]|nr:hypothetical protein [Ignavibacteria bacterium]